MIARYHKKKGSSLQVKYPKVKGEKRLGVEEPLQLVPNLVVKLYCSDNTVGEVLQKKKKKKAQHQDDDKAKKLSTSPSYYFFW